MASLPVVKTKLVCFDTSIVDLTEDLADPVQVLFGVQLDLSEIEADIPDARSLKKELQENKKAANTAN